jgi:hypothetical protein
MTMGERVYAAKVRRLLNDLAFEAARSPRPTQPTEANLRRRRGVGEKTAASVLAAGAPVWSLKHWEAHTEPAIAVWAALCRGDSLDAYPADDAEKIVRRIAHVADSSGGIQSVARGWGVNEADALRIVVQARQSVRLLDDAPEHGP